jgi:antirestriction protein ArdC
MNTLTRPARTRRSPEELESMRQDSLSRAKCGTSMANDLAVIHGFAARGINATPREDVFTYQAWLALGRQVRKGEKSLKISTWKPCSKKKPDGTTEQYVIPWNAAVFHISQTDPINA